MEGSAHNKLGRGQEPVLVYLEVLPQVVAQVAKLIDEIVEFTRKLARSPNGKPIVPIPAKPAHCRAPSGQPRAVRRYLELVLDTLARTSPKIHGIDSMYPSDPCRNFFGACRIC